MILAEGPEAARAAGLHYTTDARPGIRRLRKGRGFAYVAPDGTSITDRTELARIRSLAIPPAYNDVWISPDPRGHLQATGRDARGRKQYRYHKRWREVRDDTKFDRMVAFAKALPQIRAAVERDLALPGLPREKVLATVVALLEATALRVGNEEYARENDSYGLTTMQEDHASVRGETIRFRFRGKSGKDHDVAIRDKRLARIVKACRDLPGEDLFTYLDENGEAQPIRSEDVNAYIKAIAEDDFTAKDFRTWEATMACALILGTCRAETKTDAKLAVNEAVKLTAERLGNTPAVCRKSYVHPGVIDAFMARGALELVEAKAERVKHALTPHERAVVTFVEELASRDTQSELSDLLAASVRAESRKRGPRRGAGRAAKRGGTRPRRAALRK